MISTNIAGLFVLHTDVLSCWREEVAKLKIKLSDKMQQAISSGRAIQYVVFVNEKEDVWDETSIESINRDLYEVNRGGIGIISLGNGESKDMSPLGPLQSEAALSNSSGLPFKIFIENLTSKKIIPHIEDRIRNLEQIIGTSRRGLKNQLKSFLFRKPVTQSRSSNQLEFAAPTTMVDQIIELPEASVEKAMREQSDLCLMIGDLETAIATLKLLSSDLKADKLFFHLAAAQECLASACVLAGNTVDAISYFKNAFYKYIGICETQEGNNKKIVIMFTTRVTLSMGRYLAALQRYSDAGWIVMKAHFQEENLRAALLLEYVAGLFKKAKQPKLRKFGFHMVLAALRFGQAGEVRLAELAHNQVLTIYGQKGWDIIEEHVREALGKQCQDSLNFEEAARHFGALLNCLNVPINLQSLHLEQYQKLCLEIDNVSCLCFFYFMFVDLNHYLW